jgi:hypothetical protein
LLSFNKALERIRFAFPDNLTQCANKLQKPMLLQRDEFNRKQDADAMHCYRQNALFKMICPKEV